MAHLPNENQTNGIYRQGCEEGLSMTSVGSGLPILL